MSYKVLLIVFLAIFHIASTRPPIKNLDVGTEEIEPEAKIREKRKFEIPLLKQLEDSGIGVKRRTAEEGSKTEDGTKVEVVESAKEGSKKAPEEAPVEDDTEKTRVKKQSPTNIGGCGKTVCGPVVSARGSVINDLRTMMQGAKPIMNALGGLHPPSLGDITDAASKVEQLNPLQARTLDTLMGIAPLSLGSLGSVGYSAPPTYSTAPAASALSTDGGSLGYGHSFLKPPSLPTVPALVITQQPSHSLIHPWLMPHLLPHLMPHIMPHLIPSIMPSIGSYFSPHRIEPQRYPETVPNEIKQPVPAYPQPSYYSADNTLVCTPFRNQRLDIPPYDYIYKPDLAVDKSLNVTEANKKSQDGYLQEDEDRKMREHLRKVNEIKDEISQLNRAAQRIVDQQERLTEMQQKQLWSNSGVSTMQGSSHMSSPYMGAGYYPHPGMPWGYSRSNILSYPRSAEDIDFFLNLMRAGRKIGLLSDSIQPSMLSNVGEPLKGVQGAASTQKEMATSAVSDGSKLDDSKTELKKIKNTDTTK